MGDRGSILYGHDHGALQWAPMWFKHTIVNIWNTIICKVRGHDPMGAAFFINHAVPGPPKCLSCNATVKINGRYVTDEEIKANDDIVYTRWEAKHPEDLDEEEPKP